ncbi:MAG: 5,5-dehydrodivanillate O-demethylase oxygenase subunit [Chloroflexota bacterium]|nr:5,5-dehydrodivanillate O-demethylase oxygenase subunit [Chloroflexota bacterium]
MLTKQQNERFTQVGAGTPMGELLRRYWLPFATVKQLHDHPTRAVTLLGEHLVAFRDRSGKYGLMQEYCPHRNVNMLWGIPEPEGLRCPYHGWLYDTQGNCLEQPAESPDSTFKDRIKVTTYPVEELGGMLYAWMGPEPRPLVPRYDSYVRDDVVRDIGWAVVPCNWLQIMENSLDPVHVEHLHQYFTNYTLERLGRIEADAHSFWRQRTNVTKHVKIGFDVFEHGIVKRRVLEGHDEDHANWAIGHCIVFPFMLQLHQIRVPIDDTHTLYWWYNVHPKQEGDADQRPEDIPTYQVPIPGVGNDGLPIWELVDNNSGQDNYAWGSQGPVTPRWTEHLGESDKGIILYRRLLREQMQLVAEGKDPMNTFRDPATNQSVHIPTESDDPRWNRRTALGENPDQAKTRAGAVTTGAATKYSPIQQQRARRSGFAIPEAVEEYAAKVVGFGAIHPRE